MAVSRARSKKTNQFLKEVIRYRSSKRKEELPTFPTSSIGRKSDVGLGESQEALCTLLMPRVTGLAKIHHFSSDHSTIGSKIPVEEILHAIQLREVIL